MLRDERSVIVRFPLLGKAEAKLGQQDSFMLRVIVEWRRAEERDVVAASKHHITVVFWAK